MSLYLGNNLIAPNQSNAANKSLSNLDVTGQAVIDGKADVDLSNINASASAKNTINGWGMPDYSAGVSWSTTAGNTWTAPYDCYISAMMDQNSRFWVRKDNSSGIVLNSLYVTMAQSGANTFPVPKGTVLYVENFLLNYSSNVTIYPLKGAS